MANDRGQSPHYIPELDRNNPASGPKVKQRLQWAVLLTGFTIAVIGGGLFAAGYEAAGMVVFLIGLVLMAPIIS